MGSATEVIEIDLAAGGLFTVITVGIIAGITVGIIAGVTGLALAAPAAAVALVITAATGCQQQADKQQPPFAGRLHHSFSPDAAHLLLLAHLAG